MKNPEVERAAEVLRGIKVPTFYESGIAAAVDSLSAAGLLRTEADRLNAELAEAMVAYSKEYPRLRRLAFDAPRKCEPVWEALHAILASRKPVERWQVGNGRAGLLYTVFEAGHPTNGIVGYFPSRGHAESFAKALNAEEAK